MDFVFLVLAHCDIFLYLICHRSSWEYLLVDESNATICQNTLCIIIRALCREHVIALTEETKLYCYHDVTVSIWYLNAERWISLLDRCWLVILLTACQHRTDGMGGTGWEAWEVPLTLLPSPLAAPTTCHTHHGPDPSLTLTEAHLPSSPQNNRARSPASCVEQPAPLAYWSLNKFNARHWETSRWLGLWHFINCGINNWKIIRWLQGKLSRRERMEGAIIALGTDICVGGRQRKSFASYLRLDRLILFLWCLFNIQQGEQVCFTSLIYSSFFLWVDEYYSSKVN